MSYQEALQAFSFTEEDFKKRVEKREAESTTYFEDKINKKTNNAPIFNTKDAFQIAITFIIFFVCIVSGLSFNAKQNELNQELNRKQLQLEWTSAQTVSLQSELEAMASIENIDEYAVKKLDMRKAKASDYVYMNIAEYKKQHNITEGE